mmetsp:Transcript_47272/g.90237  ORF Transcript_47272/g.90237 Transcript_47272/m.90237 type:complete len:200 (-) Transcript_47272:111-710(-)
MEVLLAAHATELLIVEPPQVHRGVVSRVLGEVEQGLKEVVAVGVPELNHVLDLVVHNKSVENLSLEPHDAVGRVGVHAHGHGSVPVRDGGLVRLLVLCRAEGAARDVLQGGAALGRGGRRAHIASKEAALGHDGADGATPGLLQRGGGGCGGEGGAAAASQRKVLTHNYKRSRLQHQKYSKKVHRIHFLTSGVHHAELS